MRTTLALQSATPPEPATLDARGRIAFLSTMPPQRCGLAAFTADLMTAVTSAVPGWSCLPLRIADANAEEGAIDRNDRAAFRRAGRMLAETGTDILSVQHEYGIFGGPDGDMLLDLLDEADDVGVVATLHTVLDRPSDGQRRVMDALLERAQKVVVMTRRSAAVLEDVHRVRAGQVHVIPHGIPDGAVRPRSVCRAALGWGQRPTLMTFGLLSPGKGIEHAVRALPALVRQWPDLLYVVIGATHPNLVRVEGEAYRASLLDLARRLGVHENVRLVNRFVELPELMDALHAADVYVTPYNNEAQSVSGTLSYSYGLGTPVVSTPYHHAAELLANGRGVLVPFANPDAIAEAVSSLLADPARTAAMRSAARREGEALRWSVIGRRYVDVFAAALPAAVHG